MTVNPAIKAAVDSMTPEQVTDALKYLAKKQIRDLELDRRLYQGLVDSTDKLIAHYKAIIGE
jgi:hypothetical protein